MSNDGKIIIGAAGSNAGYVGDDLNNKGFFATGTALSTAFPSGVDGWYAIVGATDTIWIWDDATTSWIDSGSGFTAGGMLVATYDPTSVEGDAFDMDNMNEGETAKIFTATERTKLAGIEAGAQVNVPATWEGLPDKPTIPDSTGDLTEDINKRYVTNAQLVDIANILPKNNTAEYSPTSDYHPATKKYVDDNISGGGGGGGLVDSVNGQTGEVELTQDDIPDGETAKQFTISKDVTPFIHTASIQVDLSKPNGRTAIQLSSNAVFTVLSNPAPVHGFVNAYEIDLNGYTPDLTAFTKEGSEELDTTSGNINRIVFYNMWGVNRYMIWESYTGTIDDTEAPILSSISISNITQITARINATSNEAATLYWGVYANNSAAPSYSQLLAGTGAISYGSEPMTANTAMYDNISGLAYSTDYDIYYAASDSTGNHTDPVKIDFQTIARIQMSAPVITVSSAGQTKLNYSVDSNINGVEVYIATTSGGSYTLYETLSAGTLLGTPIAGLSQGTSRYFKAIAKGNNTTTVDSNLSIEYSGTTSNVVQLTEPTAGTVTSKTDVTATVGVTNNDVNTTYLRAQHKRTIDGVWITDTSTLAKESTSYQFTGLTANTQYDFRFIALGDGVNYSDSNPSATVQDTTNANLTPVASNIQLSTTTPSESTIIGGSYSYSDDENDDENITSNGSLWQLKTYSSVIDANLDTDNSSGTIVASGYTGGPTLPQLAYTIPSGDTGKSYKLWIKPVALTGTLQGTWAASPATDLVISSAYNAVYNKFITKPSSGLNDAYRAFYDGLKGDGILDITERLFVFSIHDGTEADRLFDWAHPDTNIATLSTVKPDFTEFEGYQGDTTNGQKFINLNFLPQSGTFHTQNNSGIIFVSRKEVADGSKIAVGSRVSLAYYPKLNGNFRFQNAGIGSIDVPNASTIGYFGVFRTSSSGGKICITQQSNTVKQSFTSVSGTLPTRVFYALAQNRDNTEGSVDYKFDGQLAIIWLGAALTDAEFDSFVSRCETLLNYNGKGLLS